MELVEVVDLLQKGGVLVAAILAVYALLTGRVVSRREFDRLDARAQKLEALNEAANTELKQQASTNARLVELAFTERQEAATIRRERATKDDH